MKMKVKVEMKVKVKVKVKVKKWALEETPCRRGEARGKPVNIGRERICGSGICGFGIC